MGTTVCGLFIAFFSGAIFLGGSKSNSMFKFVTTKPAPPSAAPQEPKEQPKYMSGSKSTFIFIGPGIKPPEPPKPADPTPAPEPTPDQKPPAKPGE